MKINGQQFQSIGYDQAQDIVTIIDQTRLPHEFATLSLDSLEQACHAIVSMQVRGAPLIGVTAAYGMYLAMKENPAQVAESARCLLATRPTAVNLQWALQRVVSALDKLPVESRLEGSLELARQIEKEDIATCEAIGEHGAELLNDLWQRKKEKNQPLNILTHCNAGALATVDWGTALAVVYKTAAKGIPVHVWVDETRPRNQGAALTCWELSAQNIPHTLIVDNAGGHLMQQGEVDVCIVGSDRTSVNGDVCNKIGTYLKALAAHDNAIPFYAALPISTIDFNLARGVGEIPIEERAHEEVTVMTGIDEQGKRREILIGPENVAVSNFGFDVTPARLISAIITEKGVVAARTEALLSLRHSSRRD